MAQDKDEAGGPPNTSSGFLVMAKNRDYGVTGSSWNVTTGPVTLCAWETKTLRDGNVVYRTGVSPPNPSPVFYKSSCPLAL
jgi:hypothetical protein